MASAATSIGFVGLGAMGLPMAINLVKAGFPVTGFDLRPAAVEALEQAGGTGAGSAAEAAAGAEILVLMVVDAAQAEAILFEAGALARLPADGVVLLTATCPPAAVQALAQQVAAEGRHLVDAPVSGGTAGAGAGSLTVMAAAPRAVFGRVEPCLQALGGRIFHVGEEPGQGATVKTVNQLLCGAHIAVAAEGIALAERLGVDPAVVLEILGGSAAASWMLKDRGPRMLMAEPPVSSAVDIFVKDLGIVLEAAESVGLDLQQARQAHELFTRLSRAGHGRLDDSQVVRLYRQVPGSYVSPRP